MDLQTINVALCSEILAPRNAKFADRENVTSIPLSDVEEVSVEWGPFSTPRELPMLKEFLQAFTWPTNAVNPTVEKRYVEADAVNHPSFIVDGQEFYGRWRQAFIRERRQERRLGEVEYFLQLTLRKGWALSLLEDEARFGTIKAAVQPGTIRITRYWENVSNVLLDTITEQLRATKTVTDPQMERTMKSGTFTVVSVASEKRDDGSGVVSQVFSSTQGDGVIFSYFENCDTKVDITFKHDLTEAQVEALDDTYASAATPGVTFSVRPQRNEETGLYDVIVETRTRQYRAYDGQSAEASALFYVTRSQRLGITSASNIPAVSASVGEVYSQEIAIRPDCTKDATTERTVSVPFSLYVESKKTPFENASEAIYRNWRKAVNLRTPSTGMYASQHSVNRDGTYDVTVVYSVGTNAGEAVFSAERTALSSTDEVLYKSRSDAIDAPAHEQGYVYQASNALGDDGLYDATLVYRASIPQSFAFDSSLSPFRRERTLVYENSTSAAEVDVPDVGTYRVSNALQPDGTYQARIQYSISTGAGLARFASERSGMMDETSVIYKDYTSPVNAPEDGVGYLYQAGNSLTDDGLYNASLVYRASRPDQAEFLSTSSPVRSGLTIIYVSNVGALSAPSANTGVYRVSQRENPDRTYSGEMDFSVGVPVEHEHISGLSALMREDARIYQNQTSPMYARTCGVGGVYASVARMNEDGTYDSTITYQTANLITAEFASGRSVLDHADAVLYRNSPYAILAGPSDPRGVYEADNAINQFGFYDGRLMYRTSVSASFGFAQEDSAIATESALLYENSDEPASATAFGQGGVYSASNRMNRDGTYSGSLTYRTSKEFEAQSASLASSAATATTHVYGGKASPIAVPEGEQGFVYTGRSTLGADGLYAGEVEALCSVPTSFSFVSRTTPFATTAELVYRNSRDMLEGAEHDVGLYEVRNDLQRDGTYNGSVLYSCGTNAGEAEFSSRQSLTGVQSSVLYKSRTEAVGANSSEQGTIYTASNSLGEDGLYDATLVYAASIPVELALRTSETYLAKEDTRIYTASRDVPTLPALGVGGVYSIAGARLNEDGTYDASVVYRTSTPFSMVVAHKDETGTVYVYHYENQAEVELPKVSEFSRNMVSGLSVNPDLTYNFTFVSRTATDDGGVQLFNQCNYEIYCVKYGTDGRGFYVAKKYTTTLTKAKTFASTAAHGGTVVGSYNGHKTDVQWLGGSRFVATRVEVI